MLWFEASASRVDRMYLCTAPLSEDTAQRARQSEPSRWKLGAIERKVEDEKCNWGKKGYHNIISVIIQPREEVQLCTALRLHCVPHSKVQRLWDMS